MRRTIILALVIFLTGSFKLSYSQKFLAKVDKNEVGLYDQFKITYTFSSADLNALEKFIPPRFEKFIVLSGPNQSTSVRIVNGAVSSEVSYTYYLQPRELGEFEIEPAEIVYNRQSFKSESIKINVLNQTPPPKQEERVAGRQSGGDSDIAANVFLKAFVDKTQVYKGEQITVTYKLFTRYNISSPEIEKLPNYSGFWTEEIPMDNKISFTTEVYNGIQFRVATLKKVALFATQTGILTITPFELKVPVLIQRRRSTGSLFEEFFNDPFFTTTQTIPYIARSQELKIKVLPLPADKVPPSFNGAVGSFTAKVEVDKKEGKVNEPITLKFTISGTGNIKLVDFPELTFPTGIETYQPKISENYVKKDLISGTKTAEYLLIPRSPGRRELPAINFSFFNPAKKAYEEIKFDKIVLNIEAGTTPYSSGMTIVTKEGIQVLDKDIRFIKNKTSFSRARGPLFYESWFIVATLFPILLFVGGLAYKRKRMELESDKSLFKFKSARKIAMKNLARAQKFLKENNKEKFFEELSKGFYSYLENKLDMQRGELTIDNLSEKLSLYSTEDYANKIKSFLEEWEALRFAPIKNESKDLDKYYQEAIKIIEELEENLNLKRARK